MWAHVEFHAATIRVFKAGQVFKKDPYHLAVSVVFHSTECAELKGLDREVSLGDAVAIKRALKELGVKRVLIEKAGGRFKNFGDASIPMTDGVVFDELPVDDIPQKCSSGQRPSFLSLALATLGFGTWSKSSPAARPLETGETPGTSRPQSD